MFKDSFLMWTFGREKQKNQNILHRYLLNQNEKQKEKRVYNLNIGTYMLLVKNLDKTN